MAASTPQVFISYRRDDTAGYARALHDALARELGAERVFIDVDDIGAGQAFDQAIAQAADSARVLLVLIGPRWLAPHAGGAPRLLADGDFVRQEVATGLARGLHVIPLLFDGAAMPGDAELPVDLKPLARRQALVIDARRFGADTQQLVAVLRQGLGDAAPVPTPPSPPSQPSPPSPRSPQPRGWLPSLGLIALAVAAGGLWWWADRPATVVTPLPTLAQPAVRAPINGRWQADVVYDWPNANFSERLALAGDGAALSGTASFLRVPRTIVEGRIDAQGIQFSTRSTETGALAERELTHNYRGQLVGDELRLEMQTVGAGQPHQPVQFVARRSAP